ncbi:hypothetical protein KKC44_03395 [Patescibacteria group bacterium]|nr:hypothetical protein [Patescibacteria group bacterium]
MKLNAITNRIATKAPSGTWRSHIKWLMQYRKWKSLVEREYSQRSSAEGPFTAIIQNYKRPWNMEPVVKALLATPLVGKVIVSNNNPVCDLGKWFKLKDERVELIRQPKERSTAERFRIAKEIDSEFFLAVDDDLFLRHDQYQKICDALIKNPSVPHGVCGQVLNEYGGFNYNIHGTNQEVDGLNRIYAFTKDHLDNFCKMTKSMGIDDNSEMWSKSLWDDMTISLSGNGKPICLNIGEYLDCPSQGGRSAAWTQEGFFEFRESFYKKLLVSKELT